VDFIERRKVRLEDFRVWIEKFSSSRFVHVYGKVSFKPNSADLLNELYWLVRDQTESRMRDVGHRLDRHKMASMLEMTVMAALPIKTSENLGNDLPFCNVLRSGHRAVMGRYDTRHGLPEFLRDAPIVAQVVPSGTFSYLLKRDDLVCV